MNFYVRRTAVDHRVAASIRLINDPTKQLKEVRFQRDGKYITLYRISQDELVYENFDALSHKLEQILLDLPPFDELMKRLQEEGRTI